MSSLSSLGHSRGAGVGHPAVAPWDGRHAMAPAFSSVQEKEERPVVGWAVHYSTGPVVYSVHLAPVPSSNFLFCIFSTVLYFNLIQISFVEYKTCHINSRQCFELAHTISSGL